MNALEDWMRRQMAEEERAAAAVRRKRAEFAATVLQACLTGILILIVAIFAWRVATAGRRGAAARAAGAAAAQAEIDRAGGVTAWVNAQAKGGR